LWGSISILHGISPLFYLKPCAYRLTTIGVFCMFLLLYACKNQWRAAETVVLLRDGISIKLGFIGAPAEGFQFNGKKPLWIRSIPKGRLLNYTERCLMKNSINYMGVPISDCLHLVVRIGRIFM
jgi:hypothetical protein